MYRQFYRLRKEPFHITPDPEFLYLSTGHREALASIVYGIEQRKGFIAITGEVGVGKTTILRSYLEKAKQQGIQTIYILNARLTFRELLRMIYYELDSPCETDEVFEMVNGLHQVLIEGYRKNHNFVLLIDEAQNLPVETLENLRMLSNLETSKDKLIQIVLVGQPELARLLDLPELRQLKQRIAVRSNIEPLSERESLELIKYRLKKAGADIDAIFTRRAANKIVKESKGIPRLLNIICDNVLITGFGAQKKPVGHKIVREVVADLQVRPRAGRFLRWGVAFSLAVLAGLLYLNVSHVKEMLGWNRVVAAPQSAAPASAPGVKAESGNLPRVTAGNEARGAQATAVTPPVDVGPMRQATEAGTPRGRQEEKAGRAAGEAEKATTSVDLTGNPAPGAAPPEKAPASTPGAFGPGAPGPAASVAEPVKSAADPVKKTVRRTVKRGETISGLAKEIYGYSGPQVIEMVKQYNPHITDPDRIMIGSEVLFPGADGTEQTQ